MPSAGQGAVFGEAHDPGVLQDLNQWQALLWVLLQQLHNSTQRLSVMPVCPCCSCKFI